MKKIISLLLTVCMLSGMLTSFAFSSNAESQTVAPLTKSANPFVDVIEGSWSYDAVLYAYLNGYMAGVSETRFAGGDILTRAMFVTIMASVFEYDKTQYEGETGFDDVPADAWFTAAVNWAVDNEIVYGYNETTFGPSDPVTREQLVLMLMKFAASQGFDTSEMNENEYLKFGDREKISTWARNAFTWASTFGLVSGYGRINGAPQSAPAAYATREQVAQIIKKYNNTQFDTSVPIGSVTIAGNDISEYSIVYGKTALVRSSNGDYQGKYGAATAAELLRNYINQATGINLPVYRDTEHETGEHEILVGITNREGAVVNPDRSELGAVELLIGVEDGYLYICSDEQYGGTFFAACELLENYFGVSFFGNGITSIAGAKSVEIPDNLRYTEAPEMEYRMNYQNGGWDSVLRPGEDVANIANVVHTVVAFNLDNYNPNDWGQYLDTYRSDDPCLSDSDNIERITRNVKKQLASRPECNIIWLCQCDAASYCLCDDCKEIYRVWGRCATYVQLLNYVGERIKDEFPNYRLMGLAYKYTIHAPKTDISDETYQEFCDNWTERIVPEQDITCPDNVIMCVAMDNSCFSHGLGDDECNGKNSGVRGFTADFEQWCRVCSNIYIFDYLNDGDNPMAPFPTIYEMYENQKFYSEHGVKGMYALGEAGGRPTAEFSEMRTFLESKLCWDQDMTYEEFSDYIDSFLRTYYGTGWSYVREFIDCTERLSSENEWGIWPTQLFSMITKEQYKEYLPYLLSLFDRALELADTDEQRDHVICASMQIKYIELVIMYQDGLMSTTEYAEKRAIFDSNMRNYNMIGMIDWEK